MTPRKPFISQGNQNGIADVYDPGFGLTRRRSCMSDKECNSQVSAEADRRAFLKTAGKFAAIVPPAMTLMLSTTMNSPAIAQSVQHGNNGVGNGVDPQP